MSPPIIFDCETDGLLPDLTTIHLLVLKDMADGTVTMYRRNDREDTIASGVAVLEQATHAGRDICGHNIIRFDIPAIKKLFPGFNPDMGRVLDTLTWAHLLWPEGMWNLDKKLVAQGLLPSHLQNRYSLEAFGHRLGIMKGDYEGDSRLTDEETRKRQKWAEWNPDMEAYCFQDAEVTAALYSKLMSKGCTDESIRLEMATAVIIQRQVAYGFLFDLPAARALHKKLLTRKLELEAQLRTIFGSRYRKDGKVVIPNRTVSYQQEQLGLNMDDPIKKRKVITGYRYHTFDYEAFAPHQKIKLVEFNPGSRDHISQWLSDLYGWQPDEYTAEGKPKVDDVVMGKLPYPEAKPLREYLLICKRIGQLAEGKESWLHHLKPNGRIHGDIGTNGTVTGRMSHKKPNMGQVPAAYSPYGAECRALFIAPMGKKLVGCDATALELCDMAGYMALYDEGAYIKVVLEGDKKAGTDIHSVNARAIGLAPTGSYFEGESGRDIAKTFFYAFLYGAGDEKLGVILTREKGKTAAAAGRKGRSNLMNNLPALGTLIKRVQARAKEVGYLRGLDGRHLTVRSPHSALNTLLQSAGAVQMKRALVILDGRLQGLGLVPGKNYEFVANVHDEWQIEVDEDLADLVGKEAAGAITAAGGYYNFRCPLAGEYRIGNNWFETH